MDFSNLDFSKPYIIGFDEFFKISCKDFFQKQDVLSAILYLNGYINNNPESNYHNSSMSIFMNHGIPKYFKEYSKFIQRIEKGVTIIHFNFFHIYLIDLRKIYLSGQDRLFLASFSSDKKFYELLNLTQSEEKEVDKVKPYIKMRVAAFEKDKNIRRQFMASSKLADIREFIKPVYFEGLEKGKLEGKLEGLSEGERKKAIETARLMKEYGDSIDKISKITGLSHSQLKEYGII
jgi:predicted transposase/invertase (TIGR01784 family)